MKHLLVRLALWLVALAICSVPVTFLAQSFGVTVSGFINSGAALAWGQERHSLKSTERVLGYLEKAEKTESDPWLRDDYRIAWITVKWAQSGVPDWSWHRDSSPHVAATYQVLRCHPDQVWPRIEAERRVNLGVEYARWYGEASSLKKPCVGTKVERRKKAASAGDLAA